MGYTITPANYKLTINGTAYPVKTREYFEHQQAEIVALVEKVEGFVSISGPENFTTEKGKELYGYRVVFTDNSNVTGNEIFYLEI